MSSSSVSSVTNVFYDRPSCSPRSTSLSDPNGVSVSPVYEQELASNVLSLDIISQKILDEQDSRDGIGYSEKTLKMIRFRNERLLPLLAKCLSARDIEIISTQFEEEARFLTDLNIYFSTNEGNGSLTREQVNKVTIQAAKLLKQVKTYLNKSGQKRLIALVNQKSLQAYFKQDDVKKKILPQTAT